MAKKPRRRTARGKSAPVEQSPANIERAAQEDLTRGRYREAIAGFKQLLKQEPRPAWRLALADAYAGRARELAAKNMLKEALVMWENRGGLGEDIAFDPQHAALLLRMGRVKAVLEHFARGEDMSSPQRDRLRALLAAAYLCGADLVVERLPADDPVVLHGAAARAALTAYCSHEDAALQTALAAIPFRSPYRDWVQLLKALQHLPDRPREAAGLLARISEESAFYRLRQAAELALLPEATFLAAIPDADKTGLHFACLLRGWSPTRIALWQTLDRLGTNPPPEARLRFMHRHRKDLGTDWVHRQGLRLLLSGYPATRKLLAALGERSLSEEENLLLAAWHAENGRNMWEKLECWEQYANHLIDKGVEGTPEAEHRLRIALALRRCDSRADVLGRAIPSVEPEEPDTRLAGHLEKSLTWDPDDRDTYLRLIGYYQRGERHKEVRRLLEQAQARWPEDMQVLEASLDAAIATGAFKKAAGIARRMLALDTINSGVRERLVAAHLAHARKQVNKGRADLARKELAAAGEWARSDHARTEIDLVAGLITLGEDARTGGDLLRDLVARLGGGLAGHLALALAGGALGLPLPRLFKQVGLRKPARGGRDDLLAALARLRTYLDGGGELTGELDAYLTPLLTKAPWRELSRSELEVGCETLRRCQLHKVRLHVARAALKRWRDEPLFELHAFEARYPENVFDCSARDLERLARALERAHEEGDARTTQRIEKVLSEFAPPPIMPPDSEPFSGPPEPEMILTAIEMVGLDEVMEMIGLPPAMQRDVRKTARRQGNEVVAEMLAAVLKMAEEVIDAEETGLPFPLPPELKSKKGPRRRSTDNKKQDSDQSDQPPDLFS